MISDADQWLDRFFAAYYRRRPVDATFIGVHDYDDLLPDHSPAGSAALVAEMEAMLTICPQRFGDVGELTSVAELDCLLAADFLTIQLAEWESGHFWRGNPSLYAGEAIFGVLGLFLREYAPIAQRAERAVGRLAAIPAFLAAAREQITDAPLAWTERAIEECGGALAFLGPGLDRLILDYGLATPGLRAAGDEAARAYESFRDWLRDDLAGRPRESVAAGSEFFDLMLRRGHRVARDGAAVAAWARAIFDETEARLTREAAQFGVAPGDWRAALALLAEQHPTVGGYLDRYRETWMAAREAALAHELVTWPDFPIVYEPFPAWARGAQPSLYFLFYRAPGPCDLPRVPIHRYLVTPIEATLPADEQERRLRAANDATIKTNHVIHHGGLGHHLQNWYATRAASRIGRIAATDCASRIAFFGAGTMAEGWACYATALMDEVGFLTPLERFAEIYARLRMAARALCDVGIHDGSLSLDAATVFYHERVGMAASAARAEAVKNSMFPGTAAMYLLGTEGIRALRAAVAAREGDAFRLRNFHDRFLAHGSLPVAIIARSMLDGAFGGEAGRAGKTVRPATSPRFDETDALWRFTPVSVELRIAVLDAMADDIEDVASIMRYAHRSCLQVTEGTVIDTLVSLLKENLVEAYGPVSGQSEYQWVESPNFTASVMVMYWFGPTKAGRQLWSRWVDSHVYVGA